MVDEVIVSAQELLNVHVAAVREALAVIAERDARIAELKAALKYARDDALEEAAIEIERIGHGSYPNKLITDGYASSVRSLKLLAARAAYRGEKE